MNRGDAAVLAFKAMAAWLIATGTIATVGALPNLANTPEDERRIMWLGIASAAVYVPVGAILWLISGWMASRVFPSALPQAATMLNRADLYAFASLAIGLYLMSDALPNVVYWLVVWSAMQGSFWEKVSSTRNDDTVVYAVNFRAQVAMLATKVLLGALLVAGPDRTKALALRLRKELSGSMLDESTGESGEGTSAKGGA